MTRPRVQELLRFALLIIGMWLVFGVFNASLFYRRAIASGGPVDWEPVLYFQSASAFMWALFTPLVMAVALALPVRRPHALRNLVVLLLLLPVLAIFRAALGSVIMNLSEGDPISIDMVRLSVAIRTHANVILIAIIIGATNGMRLARETADSERRQVALRTLLMRTEMDALRAQLQPELIFRTLQAIAAVIEKDPSSADAMIVALSQLIRESLANAGAVPLRDDVEFVRRYLELQGRSMICDIDDDLLDLQVPVFLLQPFADDATHLTIRCDDDARLTIKVNGSAAEPAAGDVLDAARTRLQRLFGADFLLEQPTGASTTLRIPLLDM
jgi:hypothetical protein